MTETVISVNEIAIRLTDERWAHITEEHSELAGMRFKVTDADGFVITAFLTRRVKSLEKRKILWSPQN
ncbi:MAG: hypothetical protein WA584_04905 [Pyrinomonadaceae bacterium]